MRIRIDAARPAPRSLEPAIAALRRGEVIIYPTDTGYAFGCALGSPRGIAALRRLKGIHEKHAKPLTMLVSDFSDLAHFGHLSNSSFRLVRRLLPGPYTMVMKATSKVPRSMKNRANEVGVRFPAHPVCTMLVELLGEPLLTGSVSSAEEEAVLEEPEAYERFSEVGLIVDGGPLWPEPSTVLRLLDDEVEVLREGQGPLPT
jgi:tRNA threonylcarbamoyl adenosine modification protein (Sua5/YciO/YrdC/YwlC family)